MADKDPGDKPSLELPSFGFGRKKSKDTSAEAPARARVERTRVEGAAPDGQPTAPVRTAAPADTAAADSEPGAIPPQARAFPALGALPATLVVGALVGLLGVLLIFASLRSCELIRGTDSCGGSGALLLIATLVALTYVGAWLLRGFGIHDPGSTSFLAVALLAVMVMVFLLDVIYSWWLVFVIPPVAMATYATSWWVTTRAVETADRPH